MEHASLASFARFTLDLLAFGAPAALLSMACTASVCTSLRWTGPAAIQTNWPPKFRVLIHRKFGADGRLGRVAAT